MEGVLGEATTLGKSIIVPSVQELVKRHSIKKVPERYICPELDPPVSATDDSERLDVPIIDMEGLISGYDVELRSLDSACRDSGFFQLINHGLNSSLLENFKTKTQDFFNLPFEEKKKYWQSPTDLEGFGQAFVFSEEQNLEWADMFYVTTFPKHERKSHLFSTLPLMYRDILEKYADEMRKLAIKILECMAKALELDGEKLRDMFGEGQQMIRKNYYPQCPEPDKVIGLTPHSDAVALTILLQLNEVDGLQIMKKGKWVTIKPFPNAFIINVGDILEIMTNGIYRSNLHRAVVNASKDRLSVATFYSPSLNKEIGPIQELITSKFPARFRRVKTVDYWKKFFTRRLDGKSYLESLRINSF